MSARLPSYVGALIVLFLIHGHRASAAPADVDLTRFEITDVAKALVRPMELAIASDGTIYWIELAGQLKAYDPRTQSIQLVGELTVTTEQENGLIGLALDPQFATNGWIYLQYSPPDFSGQYVSRFTLVNGHLDLTSERRLLQYEEQRKECCHHAGSLQFGPRGELFIATGDNTHPFGDSQSYAPLDERPERAPWDAQKSAANTQSYNGKILRIVPQDDGTYSIPEGNLFPRDGSVGRPEIYVMGCRNPWRMTVDRHTGTCYWGDVGPDANEDGPRGSRGYDEINQAKQAGNFGWPYFIGDNRPYADVDFATGQIGPLFDPQRPRNDSPNNTGARDLPPAQPAFLFYPYAQSAEFPQLGSGGRTACAGPVYHFNESLASNTKFPAAWDRALFIFDWSRHWIKVVHLDEAERIERVEDFLPARPFVRPIDMEFGPDGALYVIEYGETWGENADARMVRVDYMHGNRPPVVHAAAENNVGRAPLDVRLSSQGTFDKDTGDTLQYEWRMVSITQADALPTVLSREANPTVRIEQPGVYQVELIVRDSQGAQRSAAVPMLVGNDRPVLEFVEPRPGDFFEPTHPIRFQLAVRDTEDGTNDDAFEATYALDPIDPDSPNRVSLNATYGRGPIPSATGASATAEPAGMRRMKQSDCFNCHAVDQTRVGPPLLAIANKYRGQEGAQEASVQRVIKGSTGVWGKIPMIPHSHHTIDEIREMVAWVYSLEPNGVVHVLPGFVGEVPVANNETNRSGHYTLVASYTDRGAGDIPPLSATATLHLRQRRIEAEAADELTGAVPLRSSTASEGQFVGSINHGHYLRITDLKFDSIGRVTLRVASAGAGGAIELRLDNPNGPLLTMVDIAVNGNWEAWHDQDATLPPTTGHHDLILRFVNPQQASGLMNLDSIYLHPR